ncbi:biotin-dependent carboxyltransferase family protein [Mameliella alba]|nr:biotin-dependent carboxyltransferase family protein [Antarctobacter heliothermus]MBY6146523.1 biotin-dependent carboxyltransferase family protein [Mameliella alba]MCA0956335.1 biotin-dependent carboxyltransferase family protein [Mameliella alba]
MSATLKTLRAGMRTTLQDLGRPGLQAIGLPVSGALDVMSLRLANALVGNAPGTGALEIRFFGPRLQVQADSVRVALAGTEGFIKVEGEGFGPVPAGQSVTLPRGTIFGVEALRDSATAYLAVAGGFDVAHPFGSCATYLPAALGGFDGHPLTEGAELPLCRSSAPDGPDLGTPQPVISGTEDVLRVVLGPQEDYFTKAGIETFLSTRYTVTPQSDRMGMRLDGAAVEHGPAGFNIPSDGVVTGAIQVPGHGLPIVLLADRQTTGGYPKIATVISADLPQLARALPGTALRFRPVTPAEAEELRRSAERKLQSVIDDLRPAGAAGFLQKLYSENLISGVVGGEGPLPSTLVE